MFELDKLQSKLKDNQQLTVEENDSFERLSKTTVTKMFQDKPDKFFKATKSYGQLSIDENKKLFKIYFKVYHFENLNTYELMENNSSITSGGLGIGRAIVGGALLGGVGAVLGGVTKKRKSTDLVESLKILITFKGIKQTSTTIDFITKKQQKDKKYDKQLESAKETLAGLDYISASVTTDPQPTDSADEIRKFKSLLDDGIITQDEFDTKKSELLK